MILLVFGLVTVGLSNSFQKIHRKRSKIAMSTKSTLTLPLIESRFASESYRSASSSNPIAAERWNVEKKRMELDTDIEKFYDTQVAKCLDIDKKANERITKLYNDIYYKVKWTNPPMPSIQQKLFTDYCKHLLSAGPKVAFNGAVDLKVWKKKLSSGIHGKSVDEVAKMCKKLSELILQRNIDLTEAQAQLLDITEKKNIKKDGTLRWMIESNVHKRDEYFTVWYLTSKGRIRELDVLLNTPSKNTHIDDRDPDFGLTPLHYACKSTNLQVVQFILSKGANIELRTPDGRTALHLAAAYSTREIVLELLGLCIDYNAIDNYGCTALQLAEQNQNKKTIQTLQNWTKWTMLPEELALESSNTPQFSANYSSSPKLLMNTSSNKTINTLQEITPTKYQLVNINNAPTNTTAATANSMDNNINLIERSINTDSNTYGEEIPEEYQPVPIEILTAMSPTLKLLTKRLNAYNIYLKRDVTNYIPTEMLRSTDLSNISAMLHRSATIGITTTTTTATTTPNRMENASNDSPIGMTGSPERVNLGPGTRSPSTNSQNMLVAALSNSPFSSYTVHSNSYHSNNDLFDAEYYDTELNECMVEIRLTSKHYTLCVQEDFISEAMKSLKRRWCVAKRMWNLILLQQQYRRLIEETTKKEQEERIIELLKAPDYIQYDHDGQPLLLLNEESSQENEEASKNDEESSLKIQSGFGECSDIAVNSNLPHAKYLPATATVISDTSTEVESICNNPSSIASEKKVTSGDAAIYNSNSTSCRNNIDKEKHIKKHSIENTIEQQQQQEQQEEQEVKEDEDKEEEEESTVDDQPAVTLERILLAYNAQQIAHAEAERNPDPEYRSANTLQRPTDYDSIGEAVYKVKDNVFWETESGKQRLQQQQQRQNTITSKSTSTDTNANNITFTGLDNSIPPISSLPVATNIKDNENTTEVCENKVDFIPISENKMETNAWEVIQKWQNVSEERRHRKPDFDIYNARNDESISTSSLLTFSMTEAPSTGAISVLPDSPGSLSLATQSFMAQQVGSFGYTAGPLRQQARGTYITKLGLDLFSVYLVRKEEGSALRLLHECYHIDQEVDVTQKIALLEKKTDLLLHIYDTLQQTIVEIEKSKESNKNPTDVLLLKLNFPTIRNVPTVRTIMNARIMSMIETVEWLGLERASSGVDTTAGIEADSGAGENMAVGMMEWAESAETQSNSSSIENKSSNITSALPTTAPTTPTTPSIEHDHPQNSTTLSDDHTSHIQQPTEDSHIPQTMSSTNKSFVQFTEPIVQIEENQALLEESNNAIARIHKVQSIIIEESAILSEESITIHREEYQKDLIEPSTLAIAYIQRARIAERNGEGVSAMEYTELSEVSAVRALGGGSQLAIAIMLETLRLYVKYRLEGSSDLDIISQKARHINDYIVQFSFTNVKLADKFTQKCLEYLSISTVAINEKLNKEKNLIMEAKLAEEREKRRKLIEAQKSIGKKPLY